MPTVSVSIRNEDYDKWRALESPAEFIHNALKGVPSKDEPPIFAEDREVLKLTGKYITDRTTIITTSDPKIKFINGSPVNVKLCKHGADAKLCKFAKLGKACK